MNWNEIFIDPTTDKSIKLDWENHTINELDSKKFNVYFDDDLLIFLPKSIDTSLKNSHFHKKNNTEFDYLEHYEKDAVVFDYQEAYESPVSNNEIKRLHESILNAVPNNANSILDVGCGNAWLSKALVNENRKVLSMDISKTNPKKALENLNHKNHKALVADVFHLPIAKNSFDCIVASEIIEHVAQPKIFIEKLVNTLKKGGKLIITTPYNEKIVYNLCVHCNHLSPANAHLHSFNEHNIKELIPASISHWKYSTFFNKYAAKLRLYLLIKVFPFGIWKILDSLINKIMNKSTRLIIEITK